MKLSEAILLGDSLKKCRPQSFLTDDGSCGCAIGGALLAAGVTAKEHYAWAMEHDPNNVNVYEGEAEFSRRLWPWLNAEVIQRISRLYFDVAFGCRKLEQLVDYVRSIEPAEETNHADAVILGRDPEQVTPKEELLSK